MFARRVNPVDVVTAKLVGADGKQIWRFASYVSHLTPAWHAGNFAGKLGRSPGQGRYVPMSRSSSCGEKSSRNCRNKALLNGILPASMTWRAGSVQPSTPQHSTLNTQRPTLNAQQRLVGWPFPQSFEEAASTAGKKSHTWEQLSLAQDSRSSRADPAPQSSHLGPRPALAVRRGAAGASLFSNAKTSREVGAFCGAGATSAVFALDGRTSPEEQRGVQPRHSSGRSRPRRWPGLPD